jgi:hypothetical protein
LKKNSQKRDLLKPEEIEAGFYVIAEDSTINDRTGYFIGEVVGSYLHEHHKNNFLIKSKADSLNLWNTNVGDTTVVHIGYLVRKATDLELALT